jgi:ATP-dependent helicase Lhr and Lhr-like helicase
VATAFEALAPPIQALLAGEGLGSPTEAQERAIPRILAGADVLLIAPTGAGKTEAALLPVLQGLAQRKQDKANLGIGALYITPLRALNRDMERRIGHWAAKLDLRVEVRHGDTPPSVRRKQTLRPPDLLVTTPETLQAILPAKVLRRHLSHVRWVVVDEVHQLAKDRRGIQLTVGLERLARVTRQPFQRIALSATVGNPQEVAALFGGARPLEVVRAAPPKKMEYRVEWPKPNDGDFELSRELFISPEVASYLTLMRDVIEANRSTIVFVNSRLNAELLGSRLPQVVEGVGVHHGSLPREAREQAERALKEGRLKGLVATSTLELGIDVGSVDQAIQYQSPRQTAALVQRVGRAGHDLVRTSKGTIVAVNADDVLESLAIVRRAHARQLEGLHIHRGALDVLGHQVVGVVLDHDGRARDADILRVVKGSEAYRDLPEAAYRKVTDFLCHLHHLRREGQDLVGGRRARDYYFRNLSTIEDERTYPVVDLTTMQPVGILGEEEVVLRARKGYTFVVRGRSWRIADVGHDGRIYVNPVEDPTARIPGWQGEVIPVHWEVAQQAAALRSEVAEHLEAAHGDAGAVGEALAGAWPVNRSAVRRVAEVVQAHRATGAPMPTDRNVCVEGFSNFLVVHAPFGEVVNETLGDIVEELLARKDLVRFWWMDGYRLLYELTIRAEDLDLPALADELFRQSPEEVERLLGVFMDEHWPLGMFMKGPAERFGAIPRGLFIPADDLNSFEVRFRGTPVEDEAMREVLLEHTDFARVRGVFDGVRSGALALHTWKGDRATPLGHAIVRRYVEMAELVSPEADREQSAQRMRDFLLTERVTLLCFGCGAMRGAQVVGDMPERPVCSTCASPVQGVMRWHGSPVQEALRKHRAGEALEGEEQKELARVRQGADLVAVYGRKAVLALSVFGVGPQAAGRILARMHRDDADLFRDLYDAKLHYVLTRGFWDKDRGQGQRPREATGRPYAYSPREGASPERRM